MIWVNGGARKPRGGKVVQVAEVDMGVIDWNNAGLVTHLFLRCLSDAIFPHEKVLGFFRPHALSQRRETM